ncbi:MAG: capsular biosynthesis protein [Bacteroidia bacterium]|nr:capsular biosynthesis protein [Bacteroidia bacterium]
MHNHILFGIDDGSKSIENSLQMATQFVKLGYKKIIATPHIMSYHYDNTPKIIECRRNELNRAFETNGIELEIDFAAEYYMDEVLLSQVKNNIPLLSFQGKNLLIETSFMSKPVFFNELIFDLKMQGYLPVYAHPERYVYLHNNYEEIEQSIELGLKLQINLLSLSGYYSPMVKKTAEWMISKGYYDFLGTDAHSTAHLDLMKDVYKSKAFSKIDFGKVENCKDF